MNLHKPLVKKCFYVSSCTDILYLLHCCESTQWLLMYSLCSHFIYKGSKLIIRYFKYYSTTFVVNKWEALVGKIQLELEAKDLNYN